MMIFPQITAKSCNSPQKAAIRRKTIHRKTPKFDAKRRNLLQNAAKRCNLPQFAPKRCKRRNLMQNAAIRRKTPQNAAICRNSLLNAKKPRKLTQFTAN